MAQTAEQYFKQLFTEAGIDDATAGTVLTHFTNPKVADKVNGVLKIAQDDYNAQLGRVKAAEDRVKQYNDWYGTASKQHSDAMTELATLKAAGNGGYQEPQQIDTSKFISKDDLAKFAMDQSARTAGVIKTVGRLASRHAAKFQEELDVDALEKIATEKGLPLETAYNELIAPREEAKRNADFEAKIKAAREEGGREALSRHKLPVDAAPESASFITRYTKGGETKAASDAELLDTWNSAPKGQQV